MKPIFESGFCAKQSVIFSFNPYTITLESNTHSARKK